MSRVSRFSPAPQKELKKWSAGLYIRLSREDGDGAESESILSQRAILDKFVSEHSEISVEDYYIDDGYSGTDFERPAFERMMADAAVKKINCVIVKDLSRFGRNYVEAGRYIENIFPAFRLRFIAVNDGIDSFGNPSTVNNILVPFKNIINDEYCRDISIKVRTALDARRRQGKFIGSFAPYGYKKDDEDKNKLVIDAPAAEVIKFIFDSFISGYSIAGVTRLLNGRGLLNPSAYKREQGLNCYRAAYRKNGDKWTDSTVRRILSNEVYIGNLVQKKNEIISYKIHVAKTVEPSARIAVNGTHEGVIKKSDFDKVQSLLSRDTRVSPNGNEGKLSVFAGFIKCADCGRAMQKRTVKQPNKIYEYYVCSSYKKTHGAVCKKHAVRSDALESAVLTALNKYCNVAADFDRVIEKIKKIKRGGGSGYLSGELAAKQTELARAEKILIDLYPDFKSGIIGEGQYFGLKEKYERVAKGAKEEIARLKGEIEKAERGADVVNAFASSFKRFGGFEKLTRNVLSELVENIYVHEGGEIEIELKCKDAFLAAAEYIKRNAELVKPEKSGADIA